MNDAERVARIRRLKEEFLASEHRRLVGDFTMVAKTYRAFLGNDRELRLLLARTSEMEVVLELWNIENRPAFEAFLDEVDRLLHNYLAAVGSLRDHTRDLWRKYLRDDAAYDEQVQVSFVESGPCLFVQKLRDYTLHRKLPVTQGHMSWERGGVLKTGVQLNRPDLLKWSKWPALAKQYLAELPDDRIDLAELVASYTDAVTRFNDWFGEAFADRCRDAFVHVREMEDEIAEAIADLDRSRSTSPGV